MSSQEIIAVELVKAYRLLNHGPTVLVSAQHGNDKDVMAAAWACALELTPAKVIPLPITIKSDIF
jgi:flavin reductase (DIM6/NTAB) family NADH-FMN oxidoreductase RutF